MKKIYIFLFMIIGILIPSFSYIYQNIPKVMETKTEGMEAIGGVSKNTIIEEEIYIPKYIKEIQILFATYRRKNEGKIKIKIQQHEVETYQILDTSKIKDNKYQKIELSFHKLKKGKAKLIIEGIDSSPNNSISLYKTNDVSLGNYSINHVKANKGIIYRIKYFSINKITVVQTIFLLLTIILYFIIVNLMKNFKKNNKRIYLCLVLIIYFSINIKAPTFSFAVEPYAEIVTNFLNNGLYYNKWLNLGITDAGYWPLFQRIIGLIIIKLFGYNPKMTIIIMQNVAILMISTISSLFILKEYKKYGNAFFRLGICLILGTYTLVPYSETHTFINFSYFVLVILILLSLYDINKLTTFKYIVITIMIPLMCISKSHFVVLLPILIGIFIIFYKKTTKREKILLLCIQSALLIQIIYTINNYSRWINNDSEDLKFFKLINNVLHQLVQQASFFFFPTISNNLNELVLNLYFFIFLGVVLFSCVYLLKKNKNREGVITLALLILIFGTAMYNSVIRIWYFDINWITMVERIESRHTIFIKIAMIFMLILLIYNLKLFLLDLKITKTVLRKNVVKKSYYVLILLLLIRLGISDKNAAIKSEESFSDWKTYSKFYKNKNYLIPIEPFNWVSNRGEKVHYFAKDLQDFVFIDTKNKLDIVENQIHELNLPVPIKIEYIYLQRLRQDNFDKLKVLLYDKKGELISESMQLNDKEKRYIGFRNDVLDKEVSTIRIFNENMNEAYVIPEIFIGEPKN